MIKQSVGFLHPGEMGSALASCVRDNGHPALWTGAGRSMATRLRAQNAGLIEVNSLQELCCQCNILVSICPPHCALEIARQVAELHFPGIYVDANAISPNHAQSIDQLIGNAGGIFVDGAIIGPPPSADGETQLFLSGEAAETAAVPFIGNALQVRVLDNRPGTASALKICHSAMHKGELALHFATLASAEALGVRQYLEQSWASRPQTAGRVHNFAENLRRAKKSWRFSGEMAEVADAFADLGLPDGFHLAARDVFQRLVCLKDQTDAIEMKDLLEPLLQQAKQIKYKQGQ